MPEKGSQNQENRQESLDASFQILVHRTEKFITGKILQKIHLVSHGVRSFEKFQVEAH